MLFVQMKDTETSSSFVHIWYHITSGRKDKFCQ